MSCPAGFHAGVLQRSASMAVWPWWCASPGRTQPGACLGALYTVHSMHPSLVLVGWDGHSPGSPPYCVWGCSRFLSVGWNRLGVLHGMSEQPPPVSRREQPSRRGQGTRLRGRLYCVYRLPSHAGTADTCPLCLVCFAVHSSTASSSPAVPFTTPAYPLRQGWNCCRAKARRPRTRLQRMNSCHVMSCRARRLGSGGGWASSQHR